MAFVRDSGVSLCAAVVAASPILRLFNMYPTVSGLVGVNKIYFYQASTFGFLSSRDIYYGFYIAIVLNSDSHSAVTV